MWREWFRIIHLWVGLIGGVFIFIICFSGTLLVYQDDVIQMLNKEVYHIEQQDKEVVVEALISHVEEVTGKSVVNVKKFRDNSKAWHFSVKDSEVKGRPETIFVNPYNAEILGNARVLKGKEFFMFNFRLHRWFMMDTSLGRPIVGIFTLVFLLALGTGLVIWFPKKIKNYKNGLKVKLNANWKRINHDFHNAFGLYASIFLIIMAATGLFWSFEWYKNGMSDLIGAQVFDRSKPEIKIEKNDDSTIELNPLFAQIRKDLNDYDIITISKPQSDSNAMEVKAYHTGFTTISVPDKYFYNQYNALQVDKQLFSNLPFNRQLALSIHDLHLGILFGPLNKFIFFISSLIASLLPVTGFMIYANKKKWWKKKKILK